MTRWLVILDGSIDLDALESAGKPLQALGNRVAIVEASNSDGLRKIKGVTSVSEGLPGKTVLERLDDETRLFVEAWAMQGDMKDKERPGEDLDWDSPGFDAP